MVGGEGDDQLWWSGRGAIAGCHCRVPERRVTTNFGGSGRGAIAGCHRRVPEGRVMTNFGGVDVVPLLGAIVVCYGWGHFFSTLIAQKMGFCYLGSMLV